jgi:hypothetical protein
MITTTTKSCKVGDFAKYVVVGCDIIFQQKLLVRDDLLPTYFVTGPIQQTRKQI